MFHLLGNKSIQYMLILTSKNYNTHKCQLVQTITISISIRERFWTAQLAAWKRLQEAISPTPARAAVILIIAQTQQLMAENSPTANGWKQSWWMFLGWPPSSNWHVDVHIVAGNKPCVANAQRCVAELGNVFNSLQTTCRKPDSTSVTDRAKLYNLYRLTLTVTL